VAKTTAKAQRPARETKVPKGSRNNGFELYREKLARQRQELLALYRNDVRMGQESGDEGTEDIVDRANNAYSRELNFSLSDSERQLLLQVDEALKRLEAETYGSCLSCGQEIAPPRLQAIPWARYCIDCQELEERGMLQE
jgi:DnaK suppressor protein